MCQSVNSGMDENNQTTAKIFDVDGWSTWIFSVHRSTASSHHCCIKKKSKNLDFRAKKVYLN